MLQHILISYEGKAWPPVQSVFKDAKVLALDTPSKLPRDAVVWFKSQQHHPLQPQIDLLIKNYQPKRFVVLSNRPNAKEAAYSLSKGARAYTNAHAGPKTIKQICDVIASGNVWLGQSMMQNFIKMVNEKKPPPNDHWQDDLTRREVDVAELLRQGLSNKLIARQLNITERTVKAHISSLFEKKNVHDRLHLVLELSK